MEDKLEEVHEELLAWAEGLGVRLVGIRPMRLSGRGFGSKSTEVFASLDTMAKMRHRIACAVGILIRVAFAF